MLLTKQQLIEFLEINIPNHARVEVSGVLAEPGKNNYLPGYGESKTILSVDLEEAERSLGK